MRNDVAVVFFACTAQEFEEDYKENYADAGAGEHAFGGYVPGAGDEAWNALVSPGGLESSIRENEDKVVTTAGREIQVYPSHLGQTGNGAKLHISWDLQLSIWGYGCLTCINSVPIPQHLRQSS